MLSKLISNMEGLIAYSGLYKFSKLDAIGGYRHLKGVNSCLYRERGLTKIWPPLGVSHVHPSLSLTVKEVLWIVIHLDIGLLSTHNGLQRLLQCLASILGVHVVLGEVPGLSGSAVSVGECPQALQTLGHDTGKPLLTRQRRDEEDILRGTHLVAAVGAAWNGNETSGMSGVLNHR